jgi:hypothetical protein
LKPIMWSQDGDKIKFFQIFSSPPKKGGWNSVKKFEEHLTKGIHFCFFFFCSQEIFCRCCRDLSSSQGCRHTLVDGVFSGWMRSFLGVV